MKNFFDEFTGQFSVAKTIRMELRPVGATRNTMERLKLISDDQRRAENYKKTKPLIDDYHRWFIDDVLGNPKLRESLDWKSLADAILQYQKSKDDNSSKKLQEVQKTLRGNIANAFKTHEVFKNLDKEELFKTLLPKFWEKHPIPDDLREACDTFKRFTTYFTGFHENRANIYKADAEGVSIPWRTVNDNFPKFFSNVQQFQVYQKEYPDLIAEAKQVLKPLLKN